MSGSGRSSPEIGTRAKGKSAVKPGKGGSPLLQLVGLLLLGTGALIVWVGGQTIQASRDVSVRSGLDYEDFLEAVDDLLAGVGDSTLLRFDEVEASLSRRRTVTFDTITILADVEEFPAFDRGGFLFDQVRAYNRLVRGCLVGSSQGVQPVHLPTLPEARRFTGADQGSCGLEPPRALPS